MKINRLVLLATILVCVSSLCAGTAFAKKGKKEEKIERNHAIVQAINVSARTVKLKGYDYFVTPQTALVNEVGLRARLSDFESMKVTGGTPDRDTGSKVFFEADFEHRLLTLRMVREIPN